MPRRVHLHRAGLTRPLAPRRVRATTWASLGGTSSRAVVRKPVWPTIRWSGRTLRGSMCQVRRMISRSRPGEGPWSRRTAQMGRLVDGGQVGQKDPARPQGVAAWGSTRQGSGMSSSTGRAPPRRSPRSRPGARPGSRCRVRAGRPRWPAPGWRSPRAARSRSPRPPPADGHGEGARAHTGLEHPLARPDVRRHEDGSEVLGVDDLGPPRHLEDRVGQGGPQHQEVRPVEPVTEDPSGRPMMSSWARMPAWVWKLAPADSVSR